MIGQRKQQSALRALHFILTRARWMAGESGQSELAALLDQAEYLPQLMADHEDRTEDYRTALVDIAERYSACSHAVMLFDEADHVDEERDPG